MDRSVGLQLCRKIRDVDAYMGALSLDVVTEDCQQSVGYIEIYFFKDRAVRCVG